ncbi:MAG TPA: hypothetical protein VHE60_04770 [Pyrinomonadaceae bacterium]|nr:hypothetical protein [Pyrinomonadaceae bacterium]
MAKRETNRLEANRQREAVRIVLFGTLLLFGQALLLWAPGPASAQQSYETYFRYINDYPSKAALPWGTHPQGATHDEDCWYITQGPGLDEKPPIASLWRIPVELDLNSVGFSTPGVTIKDLKNIPPIMRDDYNHVGDPTYYKYGGQGYVLVPIEGPDPATGAGRGGIAVFRADASLAYVAHVALPLARQSRAPWCAVDQQGILYTSNYSDVSTVHRYNVKWPMLQDKTPKLVLDYSSSLTLRDEAGSVFALQEVQGGKITPDGTLLYMVGRDIHVFSIATGRRVRQSENGSGWFNYEYQWPQIPEGMVIWDLDNGMAPHIRGQLHVFMFRHGLISHDDLYFKHYDGAIDVDGSVGTDKRPGTERVFPFKTVGGGQSQAWDGAHINIKAGSYPEKLTLSKPVKLVAKGGTVTIGK